MIDPTDGVTVTEKPRAKVVISVLHSSYDTAEVELRGAAERILSRPDLVLLEAHLQPLSDREWELMRELGEHVKPRKVEALSR